MPSSEWLCCTEHSRKKSQLISKHEGERSGNYYYCDNENKDHIPIYKYTCELAQKARLTQQNSPATRLSSQVTWIRETKQA